MKKVLNICKKAIRIFGPSIQKLIAIEEMAELSKELIKMERGIGDDNCIREEIADVQIMLNQLKILYGEDQINQIMMQKAIKLNNKMNEIEAMGGIS